VLTQPTKLTASDGAVSDYFGNFVSISGNGNALDVGAYGDDISANADQGSAYVFDISKRIYLPLALKNF
jgi:FG-GAP repeat